MITVASLRPKTLFLNSKTRRLFHLVALLGVPFENDQSINDEHTRVLSPNAPSIAPKRPGLEFRAEQKEIDSGELLVS